MADATKIAKTVTDKADVDTSEQHSGFAEIIAVIGNILNMLAQVFSLLDQDEGRYAAVLAAKPRAITPPTEGVGPEVVPTPE